MESAEIVTKLKLLFERIAQPDYIMEHYYADSFFIKLNSSDPDVQYLKSLPMLADMMIAAFYRTDNYHVSVKVFLIRLLAFITSNEVNFAKFSAKKGDDLAKAFDLINSPDMPISLRVANMEVALSLLNHNSGIHWLLETNSWQKILTLCNEKKTVFIVRQTYKFVSKFVWKMKNFGDDTNVRCVLAFILKPALEVDLVQKESITSEEEDELCKIYEPMLQMLLSVVSNEKEIKSPNCVTHFLLLEFQIETYCYIMLERLRREDIWLLTTKFLFWSAISKFFLVKIHPSGDKCRKQNFIELAVTHFNTVHRLIQKHSPKLLFDYCNASNLIWGKVWNEEPIKWHKPEHVEMQKWLLIVSLVPPLVYVTLGKNQSVAVNEGEVDLYINTIMKSTCEHTARAAYAVRDMMLQLDVLQVTLLSVKRLTFLKNNLNNVQANIIFQAMYYVIKEFEPFDDEGLSRTNNCFGNEVDKISIMAYVLDTLLCLIQNYNINWQDSLEVVCLNAVVYNVLKRPNLSCKFVVTALNVILTTIKKSLTPNLCLLVDTKPGSGLHEIGMLIYVKMHDRIWEIRDTALELLLVCSEFSYIKFPPFQKQILSHKLINVAVSMALNDPEFYVRVSALQCVAAATKVSLLWEQVLSEYPNIQELMADLCTNPEGIVRKEALNVLCEMYQNLKLNCPMKSAMYEKFLNASLNDFHWEVQIRALKFWRVVIRSLLGDQGMLDGTFPPVTFSIDSRKIVTLTDKEIQKRLLKILDQLASIGCLSILVKLLYEDTEVEVMELALSIANELLEILEKHKVPGFLRPSENDPKISEILTVEDNELAEEKMETANVMKSDDVIHDILNSDDMNLLTNIYERQMNLNNEHTANKKKLTKFATPYTFVIFMKGNNFKETIERKKNWKEGIRSLSSVMEDMLGIYEVNSEVNTLDCY
ncbi:unnamed protein product [Pieris macdunnoughi]|uniref:BRCA1-associated ATM activator 1 n=1 Tax=Pieris macdunnoughi TaxID=345717 RepID=A0A821VNU6_9NEOP|nr:unnamed protein product [Pieris macdunnoughi]